MGCHVEYLLGQLHSRMQSHLNIAEFGVGKHHHYDVPGSHSAIFSPSHKHHVQIFPYILTCSLPIIITSLFNIITILYCPKLDLFINNCFHLRRLIHRINNN